MFMILSLPRSRSAWLAHYLSYGQRKCGHDIAILCDRVQDLVDCYRKQGMWGTCETGACVAWRLIRHELPELRLVTVHRPLIEVVRSLEAKGVQPRLDELAQREAALSELGRQPGVHSLTFHDLNDVSVCGWLFEYCLELEFDPEWYARCRLLNIQVDLAQRERQLRERSEASRELMAEVARRTSELGLARGLH